MLSALPKLADKAFVVGFFLPVLLFSLAFLALFLDVPSFSNIMRSISKTEDLEKLAYATLAVWLLSILLLMINHVQYRLLEGYVWPLNRISRLRARERDRFLADKKRIDELTEEWKRIGDGFPPQQQRERDRLLRTFVRAFPSKEEHLLPTRFGNAIRAFEVYSSDVYGADSVPLWPRLATVISNELKGLLDDARAQVDFMVNICCLAAILAIIATIKLLVRLAAWGPPWIGQDEFISSSSLYVAVFLLASVVICNVAYRWSIEQIETWGTIVKAAFDCYLPALAKLLGYQLPHGEFEQRAFWIAVSQMAIYHRPMPDGRWPRIRDEPEKQKIDRSDGAAPDETGRPDRANGDRSGPAPLNETRSFL